MLPLRDEARRTDCVYKDNVTFSYDNRTTALDGVSFKVPKGSSVALVGESGAGKSTILRLLYRFYALVPGQGRILIDGQDIRDVTQTSLRKAIGVVPQDPVLFTGTIASNIAYGREDIPREQIEAAARQANCEFVWGMPKGFDTESKSARLLTIPKTPDHYYSRQNQSKWWSKTTACHRSRLAQEACYPRPR